MFTEPIIFSKSFNKISYPNANWDSEVKIYCKVNLNLGLNEVISWEEGNAPTLSKVLRVYEQINNTPVNSTEVHSEQLKKDYQSINFHFRRVERNEIELKIGMQNYENKESIRLVKNIGIYANPNDFKLKVFKQLIGTTSKAVRNKYGELIFNAQNSKADNARFKIGDYVKTIIGNGVKTEREGFIIGRFFHLNKNTFMYKLLIDEKIYKSNYTQNQIELKENTAYNKG